MRTALRVAAAAVGRMVEAGPGAERPRVAVPGAEAVHAVVAAKQEVRAAVHREARMEAPLKPRDRLGPILAVPHAAAATGAE